MGIFKKIVKEAEALDLELDTLNTSKEKEEEWIWVEGFKGTDKNMQGHNNFQYELNKQFDMPEDAVIEECHCGFHFSLTLTDVRPYYDIKNNNRFFKVKALVRKKDYENYGLYRYAGYLSISSNKLAAKSIVLLQELSNEEIFYEHLKLNNTIQPEYFDLAREKGMNFAVEEQNKIILIADGYSELITKIIIDKDKYRIAHALASQPELSMDIKIYTIFCSN